LSAVEAYQQALRKVGDDARSVELRNLHLEHVEAVNMLRRQVPSRDGEPDAGPRAWDRVAQAIAYTPRLIGNTAAMHALRACEEHGVKAYEIALQDPEIPPDSQMLIRSNLLPRTRTHLHILERMMAVG
jgi:hypothetical protein